MRLGIVILFWVLTLNIYAQIPVDSAIALQEVTVMGNFEKQFLPGNGIIIPKEKTLTFYQSDNISEVLRQQSSIHIKEYGNGMLSTIAFRGTNASQTSVLWNNFNINSFTLGMTDFSLIPTQAIGEITIIPGSGSSTGGNGAFGGSVLLQNDVDFNAIPAIVLSQQVGSFGQYSTSINAKSSFDNWAFDTRLYWGKSDNDFEVLPTGQKQNNAYFERKGINQTIGYQIDNRSSLKAAIWYNDNFREIQPVISNNNNRIINNQEDKNFRSILNYEYADNSGKLSMGSGLFQDEMTYRQDHSISYLKVQRIESFADYKYYLSNQHQVKFSARHNYIQAQNESYQEGGGKEQRYNLGVQLKGEISEGIDYAVHLQQQLMNGVKIPLSPYLGFSYEMWRNQQHQIHIKANTSFNYRLPTLNDRYWNEVGNPVLNAETGWNKEISLTSQHQWDMLKLRSSVTAFHNQVENWIQWAPDSNNQWRPRNIKEVIAKGLEMNLSANFPLGNEVNIESGVQYSYIKSTVIQSEVNQNEVGKQLIYTPFHKGNGTISVGWRQFSLDTFHQLTGKVYTTNNNSETFALESFLISDLGIGWKSKPWQLAGRVKNIFNKEYQVYSGYAMPGRNYQLSIQYQINFNK
ncbi:TonB-dependent receptor plug domain-containing protein [Marivirga sp. S37H4]|uniref:TonB-dependent receptor plug domain-containing protein n=1 Tax=Marivirga aurantiaca TaxID=2802615 RepID=A0A935C8A6_9BACT|nr:TonB-dependent receptor [Marivirga aurantiaca]MBK6263593.1 TonB-dependent receptor plug domain-containing protein [Marivirga aurantiaca]